MALALALAPSAAFAVCGEPAGPDGRLQAALGGSGSGGTALRGNEGSGTGGTGATQGGTGGLGGTGLFASAESGSGGTGATGQEGSGAGGTGILGTVMAFGSVCVNGLEVEYGPDTPVEHAGRRVSTAELAIGQIVRIETRSDDPASARRIAVETALAGPVERVDLEARQLWIMGQRVLLAESAIVFDWEQARAGGLAKLDPGSRVEVSGLRRSDGVVVATRIDRRGAAAPAVATGAVVVVRGRTLYVGEVRAVLGKAQPTDTLEGVRRARVRGRWNRKTRTLEGARLDPAPAIPPGVGRLSLQGYAAPPRGDGDFRLAGTAVDAGLVADALRDLAVDARVRVEGRIDSRGRLRAKRIVVEERGRTERPLREFGDRARGHKADRSDRSGREEERSGRSDRPDRSERPERRERPERPDRAERPPRSS